MKYYLGIDIGSVSVKSAVIDCKGKLLNKQYSRSEGQPLKKLTEQLSKLGIQKADNIVATGSGKKLLKDILGIRTENEIVTNMVAAYHIDPDVRTVIEIGGQDSKLIFIEDGPTLKDHSMNEVCAAGTGSFLDQQAERLGISVKDFGKLALRSKNPANIAGRCTVFAKTDMIHLQQEGYAKEDIVNGLCYSLARNFIAGLGKNREIKDKVFFQGAVAANRGVVRSFESLLQKKLIIPKHYRIMGAFGSALIAKQKSTGYTIKDVIQKINEYIKKDKGSGHRLPRFRKYVGNTAIKIAATKDKGCYLGVDVGSISIDIVVINRSKEILYQKYYYTKGEPLRVIKQALSELGRRDFKIKAAGITGSGRYLFGEYIGADIIKNEITCQARAAYEVDSKIDTVIEIGGQDSKFIRLKKGKVINFEMNKVCAAGTGSFLEEQAKRLDVDIKDFGRLAFKSQNPLDLGTKCTVFMESDVIHYQQQGHRKEDIIAGLAYAIARNYLDKVVINRKIGNHIIFLGGVASNRSVVSAFKKLLKKRITVPPINKVSGAYGAALISCESNVAKTRFNGFELDKIPYSTSHFICDRCINRCNIEEIKIKGNSFYFGSLCGRYDKKKDESKKLPNYFELHNKALFDCINNSNKNKKEIGIPRIFLFYDYFPLWAGFFNNLGFNIVVSDETNRKMSDFGLRRAVVDTCFPVKSVYGHIKNLIDKGVKKIFYPSFVELEPDKGLKRIVCPYKSTVPQFVYSALGTKIISPVVSDESGLNDILIQTGKDLGFKRSKVIKAYEAALNIVSDYRKKIKKLREDIDIAKYEKIVIVMGKRYNLYNRLNNLNLAHKFMMKGILPLPMDILPLENLSLSHRWRDLVWKESQDIIKAASFINKKANLFPVFVTNFGCGQDSFLEKHLEKIFKDKPYVSLEIDEHTADAGILTRIEAFIDTLENKHTESRYNPYAYDAKKLSRGKTYFIPNNADNFVAIKTALGALGYKAEMLPRGDMQSFSMGSKFSSGKECLAYIFVLGDLLKLTNKKGFDPKNAAFFLAAHDHCLANQYPAAYKNILGELGIDLDIVTARIYPEKDEVREILGLRCMRIFWNAWISIDYMHRLYHELKKGSDMEREYKDYLEKMKKARTVSDILNLTRSTIDSFNRLKKDKKKKPIIALVGEPYVLFNENANSNLIKQLEDLDCEVWLPPHMSDYLRFIEFKRACLSSRKRQLRAVLDNIRSKVAEKDEERIAALFKTSLCNFPEPTLAELFRYAEKYISDKHDPLTVFTVSKTVDFINKGVDGIINVMSHHCLVNYSATAILKSIVAERGTPIIDMIFTGQQDTHVQNRLEAFVYQVKQKYS